MKQWPLLLTLLLGLALPLAGWADDDASQSVDDLFGGGGGYIHPYVTIAELYDDNVYRTPSDKISDRATIYSPGILLAVPGTREKRQFLNTSTLTPGGLGIVEDRGEEFQRFQGYLHYRAALARYAEEDDNDTDDQRLDGLLQFNLKSGLTFEVLNFYLDGHDERGEGAFGNLDTYKSNLAGGRVTYDLGARFRVRGEYGHFTVNYDADDNRYLDRVDDKYSAYLFYKLSGKSTLFTEYDLVDISYDQDAVLDSSEQTVWGGLRWRLSGKSIGEVKAGYLNKDNQLAGVEDKGDLVVKGWLDYELTGKSRFRLTGSRLVEEPDAYSQESSTVDMGRLAFIHKTTPKVNTTLEGGYGHASYEGEYSYQGETGTREDDIYTGRVLVDYQIQDWLGAKASYLYLDRESSFSNLSYTDNRVLLSLTLSL